MSFFFFPIVHRKHLHKKNPTTVLGQMFHLTFYIHCFFFFFFPKYYFKTTANFAKVSKVKLFFFSVFFLPALSLKASHFSEKNVLVKEKTFSALFSDA